jgi:hypothetical protein
VNTGFVAAIKSISEFISLLSSFIKTKKEDMYRHDIEEINDDPVGRWNRRFLRERVRDTKDSEGSNSSD